MTTCPFCASSITDHAITCPTCGATLAGLQLEVGFVLFGKYRLEKILGQGGFGITYQAVDESLNRLVAIKELFPEGSTRNGNTLIPASSLGANGFAQTKQRFLEEAQTLAQFNHPGIVKVFEVFEAHGTAYIAMEALTGETLGMRLARETKLSEIAVKRLAVEICAALEVVHQTGLLHRDIKPDNVFITKENCVVLIDFGSARDFQTGHAMKHTQLVSPGYAAPEQYASQAKFGTYTDIYGLSATLFHATTGKPPPTASDRVISSDMGLHLPDTVIEPLRTALTRGLALRIDERPQTAKDFVGLLEEKTSEISIKIDQVINAVGHEEVLHRSDSILVTTKQIEVFVSEGKSMVKNVYPMSDISEIRISNNYIEAKNIDFQLQIFAFIFGVGLIIASTVSFYYIDYFKYQSKTNNPIFFPFIAIGIGIYLCYSFLKTMFLRNEKNIYYVLILTKTQTYLPSPLEIFSGKDQNFAEELAKRIRGCITP
jgi:serine/threonine protein kinase